MFTVILHDPPNATGRSLNGLRFAEKALDNKITVRVFLFSGLIFLISNSLTSLRWPPFGQQSPFEETAPD